MVRRSRVLSCRNAFEPRLQSDQCSILQLLCLGPAEHFSQRLSQDPFLILGGKELQGLAKQVQTFAIRAGETTEIRSPQQPPGTVVVEDALEKGMKVAKRISFSRKAWRRRDHHDDSRTPRQCQKV